MRKINWIVLHCTEADQHQSTAEILKYWKEVNGWKKPGYHEMISADGHVDHLLPIEEISNGVAGHNADSIHICYKGGIDEKGRELDNRTIAQIQTQIDLIKKYKHLFPNAKICGHRDFPGVTKRCPSFDVAKWLKRVGISN